MKKYQILIIFLIMIYLLPAEISFIKRIEIENYYDDNILKLSDSTLEVFESGTNSDKFRLQSSDDMISSFKLDLGIKHLFAMGHTQINRIVVKYNKYWNNDFKDDYYLRLSLQQFLNRKMNLKENYINLQTIT